jgi:hypothetical protein
MKKILILLFSAVMIAAADQVSKIPSKRPPVVKGTKITHAKPGKIAVQWVKTYGNFIRLINMHPVRDGYAFFLKPWKKKHVGSKKERYTLVVVDGKGRRVWETNYEPDKIRYPVDFRILGNNEVYVLGWGGKRLDVWFIEKFVRNRGKGKRVARMQEKYTVPFALLTREGQFVALGHTLREKTIMEGTPIAKKLHGLVVWKVGRNGENGVVKLRRNVTGLLPYSKDSVPKLHFPPCFRYRSTSENGLLIMNNLSLYPLFDKNSVVVRLSPALMQEMTYPESTEAVDIGYDVILAGRTLKRCDERCGKEKWATSCDRECWGLLADRGSVISLKSRGDVFAVNADDGKRLWEASFSKTERYRCDSPIGILKNRGSTNEYIRVALLFHEGRWKFQLLDFKVMKKRGSE